MLDTDTRRRIDAARDVLVGKVPDPKSQVEQITIALIYKFMDDMDAENEEWGGNREFFAGEFEQYRWASLVRGGLGGHEMLNRYAEAITRMQENPGIPVLFRSIFNNAFLPYRDPETLRLFLREVDGFEYSDSEALGDAFEYLLSVLGSQGDAGQFRTPRHIIDFIVGILDPKKDETVLDPACGTAGFMISAWKHILNANMDGEGGSALTPDERERLARNFTGYDISPDMVRLSLVNMYLHGFANPRILEYDTLTSEDHWHYHADVVLANPPFMNPKGGIRPHKRFSVQSTRSEVLFVDYMAEHLTPNGRAGIIVPEGVIFQSQRAHTQLRKTLVENYLVAVISLPAGVFKPYSGVKTSILILDKALARQTDTIAFFKVENDGYDLGDQRRPIEANDLPGVQAEIADYLRRAQTSESLGGHEAAHGFVVAKSRIAEGGAYNLSAERYREKEVRPTKWPMVHLGEVVEILDNLRKPITKHDRTSGIYPYYGARGILDYVDGYIFDEPLVLIGEDGARWNPGERTAFSVTGRVWVNNHAHVLRPRRERILDQFLVEFINQADLMPYIMGVTVPKLNQRNLKNIEMPLPPLDVQREIVAEVEGYQRVIDGARAVLDGYRPHVPIDPSWPLVPIGEICHLINGRAFKPSDWETVNSGGLSIVRIQNLNNPNSELNYYTGDVKSQHIIDQGQLLFSWSGSRGTSFGAHIWHGGKAVLNQHIFKVDYNEDITNKMYLFYILNRAVTEVEQNLHGGVGLVHITKGNLEKIQVPLPSLAMQQTVVEDLEAERALVKANRELITRMKSRIAAAIDRVWGEG